MYFRGGLRGGCVFGGSSKRGRTFAGQVHRDRNVEAATVKKFRYTLKAHNFL